VYINIMWQCNTVYTLRVLMSPCFMQPRCKHRDATSGCKQLGLYRPTGTQSRNCDC